MRPCSYFRLLLIRGSSAGAPPVARIKRVLGTRALYGVTAYPAGPALVEVESVLVQL